MIAVVLAQLRIHWARFLAVGLGIALAAGFVASTLIINSSLQTSLREAVGETFSRADLVIIPEHDVFLDGRSAAPLLTPLSEVDGVESVAMSARTLTTGRGAAFSESTFALSPAPADPRLDAFALVEGSRPDSPTDLVLDTSTARDLGVGIGDDIRFSVDAVPVGTGDDEMPVYRGPDQSSTTFTVVGIADIGKDPAVPGTGRALTTSDSYQEHFAQQGDVIAIQIGLSDSADFGQVRAQLHRAIAASELDEQLEVLSVEMATDVKTERLSGSSDVITALLLVFAGISVVVAILVVSNTFSVIVAGRRRELALLRCLGASRSQIYTSVVAEGLFVGLIASILGVLAGVGFSYVLSAVAARVRPDDFSFGQVTVPVSALVAGIAAGAVLTILATVRPARSAIAVTPLEALQPWDASFAPSLHKRSARQIIGVSSVLVGVLLLIASLLFIPAGRAWILAGAVGGGLVVVGLVMCSALVIPPIAGWVGEVLFSPWGVPGQLATVNTLRNPRRTAATASALIIGVTLVTTILIGGTSTKATLGNGLEQRYPVDISVPVNGIVGDDVLTELREIDGVAHTVVAHRAEAVDDYRGSVPEVYVLDPESAAAVLGAAAADLVPGRVVVPEDYPDATVRIRGLTELSVPVAKDGQSSLAFFTTPDVGNDLGVSTTATSVLIRLDEDVDVDSVFAIREQVAEALDVPTDEVGGSAVARGSYSELIDLMLIGAVGLLFVAVLIALIGVSNTVSLSVIERRRENSLMRALGLSISQLRVLLALEAVLISSVAALIGLMIGGGFGIMGTRLITYDYSSELIVDVAPGACLGILAVAVIAGILSALAPAQRAAKLSPVEGLKFDY